MKRIAVLWAFGVSLSAMSSLASQQINIDSTRWLEVAQARGSILRLASGGRSAREARQGDRLAAQGHGITTGRGIRAELGLDTSIGRIYVGQASDLEVLELDRSSDNGRITRLLLNWGNVNVLTRDYTHQSYTAVETPSGAVAINREQRLPQRRNVKSSNQQLAQSRDRNRNFIKERPINFSVSVDPSRKASIANQAGSEGSILVEAARGGNTNSVQVAPGFETLVVDGRSPTTPRRIANNTSIDPYGQLRLSITPNRQLKISGRIDAFNLLILQNAGDQEGFNIGNEEINLDRLQVEGMRLLTATDPDGRFDRDLPLRPVNQHVTEDLEQSIEAVVITPSGRTQTHTIWSQTCIPLRSTRQGEFVVSKTARLLRNPFNASTRNEHWTDFEVPPEQLFERFVVTIRSRERRRVSLAIGTTLKYEGRADQVIVDSEFFRQTPIDPIGPEGYYQIQAIPASEESPSRVSVEVRSGDLLRENDYTVSIAGCNSQGLGGRLPVTVPK